MKVDIYEIDARLTRLEELVKEHETALSKLTYTVVEEDGWLGSWIGRKVVTKKLMQLLRDANKENDSEAKPSERSKK